MNNTLDTALRQLNLPWIRANLDEEVALAVRKSRPHHELLERLVEGELATRFSRSVERRLRQARLPRRPTLASFDFNWPNRMKNRVDPE